MLRPKHISGRRVSFPTVIIALLLSAVQAHGDQGADGDSGGDGAAGPAAFLDSLNDQLAHTQKFIDKGLWTAAPPELLPSGADALPTMDFGASTLTSIASSRDDIWNKHGDVVRQTFNAWFVDDGTVLGPADAGQLFFVVGNTEPSGLSTFVLYQPTGLTANPDGSIAVTLTLAGSGLAHVDGFPGGTDYTVVSGDPTAVEYAVMLALIIVVCLAAITIIGKRGPDCSTACPSTSSQLGTTTTVCICPPPGGSFGTVGNPIGTGAPIGTSTGTPTGP
jgi:hypothetical protein